VWLTVVVYQETDIRGYVPAGIGGMTVLGAAGLGLLIYLAVIGRRRNEAGHYVLGGCLSLPAAIVVAVIYVRVLIALLGRSLTMSVVINLSGAAILLSLAVVLHRVWLSTRSETGRRG